MSTTPTTSETVPYTVVGGPRDGRLGRYSSRFTIVLLNREGKLYRDDFLREFGRHEFAQILCVDGPDASYDVEARSRRFPSVRFLLLKEHATIGATINLAVEEARSRLVMVLWSNMTLPAREVTTAFLDQVELESSLCVTLPLMTESGEWIPTVHMPVFIRRRPRIVPLAEAGDRTTCLYPFDFCGIYSRERFLGTGGFDPAIANPYWQKLDFGFRGLMWGERILHRGAPALRCLGRMVAEDTTRDAGYKLFFLKNIAVRVRPQGGLLSRRSLLPYLLRSDTGPLASWREFNAARRWVARNSSRFVRAARSLPDLWDLPE